MKEGSQIDWFEVFNSWRRSLRKAMTALLEKETCYLRVTRDLRGGGFSCGDSHPLI